MGIFSSAEKKTTTTNPSRHDLQKALFVLGCAMCMADGEADENEIMKMESVAARMPLFANNTTNEDTAVMREAGLAYDAGAKAAVNWAIGILQYQNWRAVSLCMLCEIIMADGQVDPGEMKVLNGLSTDLNVDLKDAQAIFSTFEIYYQKYTG